MRKMDTMVDHHINELLAFNQEIDFDKTVLKIKEIVPECISNNSVYEELDDETELPTAKG